MKTKEVEAAGAKGKVPATASTGGTPVPSTGEPPEEAEVKGPAVVPDELAKYYFANSGFNYIGMDSTSIIEVTMIDGEPVSHINELNKDAEEWLSLLADKKIAGKRAIDEAVDVLDHTVAEVNIAINHAARTTADAAISIGKVLLALKPLIKAEGMIWVPWVSKNLTFISTRSIQQYMRIAERADCQDYSYLGLDALDHLCSVTEGFEGEDKIKTFLKTYGIKERLDAEFDLTELKLTIDTGCNCEELKKHGVEFDFETVKLFTMQGQKCDKALINELLRLKKIGANPANYLQLLVDNKGVPPSFLEEDEGGRQLKDVNSLSSKLVITIDSLVGKHETRIKDVDTDILMKAAEKIKQLIEAVSSQVEIVTT